MRRLVGRRGAVVVMVAIMDRAGQQTQPTIQGALGQPPAQGPGFCATITGAGDCFDASGNHPVVRAPFYVCTTGCAGRTVVGVMLLGSFTIEKIIPTGSNMSAITGIFNPMTSSGPVGSGGTTLISRFSSSSFCVALLLPLGRLCASWRVPCDFLLEHR